MIALPSDRIVRGAASATLTWQPYDADGEPADPDGTVTVAVTRADGTAVTAGGVAGTGSAARTSALAATELTTVDWLTAAWKVDGTTVAETVTEVCGGTIGTLAEIRAADASLTGRDAATLTAARRRVEDMFTDALGRGVVERFYAERVSGRGTSTLVVSWPNVRDVRFVRVYTDATTYTSFTAGELAAIPSTDSAVLERTDGGVFSCGKANIEVGYTFGLRAVPGDLRKAMIAAIRADIASTITGIPDRAVTFQMAEGGTFNLATPGTGQWVTGVPAIDEAIKRYRFRRIGVA
jgi:hypothetical protein